MKNWSKKFIVGIITLIPLFCNSTVTHIVVESKNGAVTRYAITGNPHVGFKDSELLITLEPDVTVTHTLTEVQKFYYEHDRSSVESISNDKKDSTLIRYNPDGNVCILSPSAGIVRVFSMDGQLILSKRTKAEEETSLSLADFSPGVYLININGKTAKIIKR